MNTTMLYGFGPTPIRGLGATGQGFLNITSGLSNVFNSGAQLVSSVKGGAGSGSAVPLYTPTVPGNAGIVATPTGTQIKPPDEPKKSNTMLYVGLGVGVLAIGTIIYVATRKKKS